MSDISAIDPHVVRNASALAADFRDAKPFRHVVIENFFTSASLRATSYRFPRLRTRQRAQRERRTRLEIDRGAHPRTRRVVRYPRRPYPDATISRADRHDHRHSELLYDPWYFGGGTHENREGQDLDAHVDFNRHPVERWHRRLNLIVYLNHEWDDAWGGSLELHSDPRADDDRIKLVTPLYNRAVIFETTETSWHGFSRIGLPDDKKNLSRRSIALYFYTKDRPAEELADTHSTIYVDRPLPDRFKPGHVLTEDDVQEMRVLLARRDQHNQRLYRDVTNLTAQLERAEAAVNAGNVGRLQHFAQRILRRFGRRQ